MILPDENEFDLILRVFNNLNIIKNNYKALLAKNFIDAITNETVKKFELIDPAYN